MEKKTGDRETVTNVKRDYEMRESEWNSRYVTCLGDEIFFLLHSQDTSVSSISRFCGSATVVSCPDFRGKARYSLF